MFHVISRVAFFIVQPSNLALISLLVGLALLRLRPRTGRWLIGGGLTWIIVAGFLPVGNVLVLSLENRFAARQPSPPTSGVTGIIILGGFEDGWVTAGRGGLGLNEAAERLTEALRIARSLPDAKVVFTGGVGALFDREHGGDAVRDFLVDAGISPDRILIETESRDTYENAAFTRRMVGASPNDTWLLVTSAYHMPRAMGAFRQAGFEVTAFPVDFRTRGSEDLLRPFSTFSAGLARADLAAKEWLGLVAYWVTGRSSSLFPGPDDAASAKSAR
ncbi:YdcF family protein [Hyphomicrobium methylovorum]|uniref:YdcF family protein n=1 Tax=Hyphomicrobium methylovorum TaxID=84 RepID=UPI0015E6B130|nr:YdcF family protein [Hyphomicrobium methylovorum]MBA2125505.1 YdcF family protein [Hyphomicrobium methylovorum]